MLDEKKIMKIVDDHKKQDDRLKEKLTNLPKEKWDEGFVKEAYERLKSTKRL
ncbi:hypothetical protein [Paenibacillus sp. DMB20]|uniref:hypothetical protein n=1 Tax=Paenibacillus sp. DMB20 TaxID=1642570 RepID=UPI000A687169|nr:hypothetical protein [Paenibacillus sp. DMB20]